MPSDVSIWMKTVKTTLQMATSLIIKVSRAPEPCAAYCQIKQHPDSSAHTWERRCWQVKLSPSRNRRGSFRQPKIWSLTPLHLKFIFSRHLTQLLHSVHTFRKRKEMSINVGGINLTKKCLISCSDSLSHVLAFSLMKWLLLWLSAVM